VTRMNNLLKANPELAKSKKSLSELLFEVGAPGSKYSAAITDALRDDVSGLQACQHIMSARRGGLHNGPLEI